MKKHSWLWLGILFFIILVPPLIYIIRFPIRFKPKADIQTLQITTDPESRKLEIGTTMQVKFIGSFTDGISAGSLDITLNPDVMHIVDVKGNSAVFSEDLSMIISPGHAKLSVIAKKTATELPRGPVLLGTLTLQAISTGNAQMQISTVSQLVGPDAANNAKLYRSILATNTDFSVIQPVSTPAEVAIKFSVKFSGIDDGTKAIPLNVRVRNPANTIDRSFTIPVLPMGDKTFQTDGFVNLPNIPANETLSITLKGPKHISQNVETAKKFAFGQTSGNIIDWSKVPLMPGDLPNPDDGNKQDDKVNSLDVSLLLSRYGKTDQESVDVADLNNDGVVTLYDFALMLQTMRQQP